MNERMYKLINQCFIGTTDGKLSELNSVTNIENFAKLLVEECANICYNSPFQDSDAHAQNILFEFDIDGCRNNK